MRQSLAVASLVAVGIAIGSVARDFFDVGELNAQDAAAVSPYANTLPMAAPVQNGVISPITNPQELINISVYENTNRGVVNISTKAIRAISAFREAAIEGSGSGSVISQEGHILTNYHVVEGAREINVTLYNGNSFPADLVGYDADTDIAVLRLVEASVELYPIPLGNSGSLRVGQHIIAIGNPFGLERTMSDGIISSLNRQITSKTGRLMKSIIQIDAALNQGNSGGPLLNSAGELIGMNTAIATSTGDNAGIGFAIPVNTITRVIPQLIENGRFIRPTIGITKVFETEDGLMIVSVTEGGPAAQAGLRGAQIIRRRVRRGLFDIESTQLDQTAADTIIGVDGEKIETADDLLSVIESKRAGERVILRIIRQGEPQDIAVTLGEGE